MKRRQVSDDVYKLTLLVRNSFSFFFAQRCYAYSRSRDGSATFLRQSTRQDKSGRRPAPPGTQAAWRHLPPDIVRIDIITGRHR